MILTSIAVAILTAAAEVLVVAFRRWSGAFTWTGAGIEWMAPTGYLLVFAVPALIVAPLAGRFRWFPLTPLVGGVGTALGVVAVVRLLGNQRIPLAALLLLGTGVGFQVARLLHRKAGSAIKPLLTRALLAGTLGLAVGAASLWMWQGRALRRSVQLVRSAPSPGPNILLLVLDTVRAASMSLYGHVRPTTPLIDRWAGRSTVFDNAFATTSWTLPSHASMFTGQFPTRLSADWLVPLDTVSPTLAEVLRARGYRTGGFVANQIYTDIETGLARGFDRYRGHPPSFKRILLNTELGQLLRGNESSFILRFQPRKAAEVVNREFLGWLGERNDRPFFAFLNYFDAHIPYHVPDSVRALLQSVGRSPEERYEVAIRYLDLEIDALLQELDRRGLLENTLVIITSDHGEQFATRGLGDHGNSLYLPTLHVPMMLMLPGTIPAGQRITEGVSLRNLPATILDLAGVGGEGTLPGESWARFWRPSGVPQRADEPILSNLTPKRRTPPHHRNALGELRSLIEGSYHYILNGDGSEEYYLHSSDPNEQDDLLGTDQGREPLARMRNLLRQIDSLHPRLAQGR